eukprot:m.68734 g.68734  ORF g.68734 m.68734 type:complete len:218 (-) comp11995_c0_seq2:212-865(-)
MAKQCRNSRQLVHSQHTKSQMATEIAIGAWCSRVGKSSWDMNVSIEDPINGKQLAKMVSTLVSVDETLTKSKPLPNVDVIKSLTTPSEFPSDFMSDFPDSMSRPLDVPHREGIVRLVDTDKLRHINNCKYVFLACEELFLQRANIIGRVDEDSVHDFFQSVDGVYVQYTGQLKAGEVYKSFVWRTKDLPYIQVDFEAVNNDPMCSVIFRIAQGQAHL